MLAYYLTMFQFPITDKLRDSRSVLLAGAGGGFDVFSGLPLYFALKQQNKSVHLANWTFSEIESGPGSPIRLTEFLAEVNADSKGAYYFPERYLCEWFRGKGENLSIYCLEHCGTQELKECYDVLVKKLDIDTIILIDGGTDSLLRGDEERLGTPQEDMTSIAAVDQVEVPTKVLCCLGFGIDTYHGVCHAHVLSTIAEQTKKNGFLGAFTLLKSMPEVAEFCSASQYVFSRMTRGNPSIVVSSILSALDGEFGDHHFSDRTAGSELFINPLMCFYWFFDLNSIANSIVYMDELRSAKDSLEAEKAIMSFSKKDGGVRRRWKSIPL